MLFRKAVVVVVGLILVTGAVHADTKVVQQNHTDAVVIMGQTQPATDRETVSWFGDDRMAVLTGETDFIIRLDQQKVYVVDHNDKTYSELTLPVDLSAYMPPQMAGMMKFDVTLTPTDEYKQIGEWRARRYNINLSGSMMQIQQVFWTTTDVDIDFEKAKELSKYALSLQPGMESMIKEMDKIEGFPVLLEATTKVMGSEVKNSTKTVSITSETPPAGIYEPPSGYAKGEFNPMKQQAH